MTPFVSSYQRVCIETPRMRPCTLLFGRKYDAVANPVET